MSRGYGRTQRAILRAIEGKLYMTKRQLTETIYGESTHEGRTAVTRALKRLEADGRLKVTGGMVWEVSDDAEMEAMRQAAEHEAMVREFQRLMRK